MENGFKNLKVWQEAKQLAIDVYHLCKTTELAKDFGLKDQISRAAVSVPSNIAEGDTNKDSVRFFHCKRLLGRTTNSTRNRSRSWANPQAETSGA
jgi:hypothetical protein